MEKITQNCNFKIDILVNYLSKIPHESYIGDLVLFASKLHECNIQSSRKLLKLSENVLSNEENVKNWINYLDNLLIGELINEHHENYDYFRKEETEYKELHDKILKLFKDGWSIKCLKIFVKASPLDNLKDMLFSLDSIIDYKLKNHETDSKGRTIIDIIKRSNKHLWSKEIHDLALYRTFKGSSDKNIKQLIEEILDLNKDKLKSELLKKDKLFKDFEKVEGYRQELCNWNKDDIKKVT